jgi:hypothetical protein
MKLVLRFALTSLLALASFTLIGNAPSTAQSCNPAVQAC